MADISFIPDIPLTEWIGYAASALILISMMMASVLRLRVINLVGSLLFVVYGIVIQAYPVSFMNGCIAVVNIWYIFHIRKKSRLEWHVVEVCWGQSFVQAFIERNKRAFSGLLSDFRFNPSRSVDCWVLIVGDEVVGLFCGFYADDQSFEVQADFVSRGFQDLDMRGFMYSPENIKQLRAKGLSRLVARPQSAKHRRYLEKMHFIASEEGISGVEGSYPLMYRDITVDG